MSVPSRPRLLPGESLASLLVRYAERNLLSVRGIFDKPHAKALITNRTLSRHAQQTLAEDLGLDPAGWEDSLLTSLPRDIVGDTKVGPGTTDPLGWSLTYYSTRCGRCQREDQPWPVLAQTGLHWICTRHQQYLRPHCARCSPRYRILQGHPIKCIHHGPPPSPDEAMVGVQTLISDRLTRATDGGNSQWFRTLRAATAIAYLDAALAQRSPKTNQVVVAHARPLLARRRRTGPGHVGLRLDRPPPEPWINAHLTATALAHLDEDHRVDHDWARTVAIDALAHPSLATRTRPFFEELAVEAPGQRLVRGVHPTWYALAEPLVEELRRNGYTPDDLPAALRVPTQDLASPWPDTLARSALLHHLLSDGSLTGAVTELGHHFTHVSAVFDILSSSASRQQTSDFHAACSEVTRSPRTDYAERRRIQQAVTHVPPVISKHLQLAPPRADVTTPGQAVAAWLWCATTGGHPVAVPFVDGRRMRSLTPILLEWQTHTPEDRLLGLLQWNHDQHYASRAPAHRVQGSAALAPPAAAGA